MDTTASKAAFCFFVPCLVPVPVQFMQIWAFHKEGRGAPSFPLKGLYRAIIIGGI